MGRGDAAPLRLGDGGGVIVDDAPAFGEALPYEGKDAADVAFEAGSDEMTSQLAELDSRELSQIDRALIRLKQGTYGLCEACQKKIPVGRLNALPYTTHCIECQREMDCQDARRVRLLHRARH